jgi:hypothetical protein
MPIEIFSELDGRRMETRKVEVFRGGTFGFASAHDHSGKTRLGIEPVPSVPEIASQSEFTPRHIDRASFEEMWNAATKRGRVV